MYIVMKMRKKVGIKFSDNGNTYQLPVEDMAKGVCGVLMVFANRADAEAAAGNAGVVEIEVTQTERQK